MKFMDAVAPGLLLAQAIGRWGNWWNQELFGKPTDLPWGLKIDSAHRRRVRRQRDLPPDVPLRVRLRPHRRRDPAAARPALPVQAARAVLAVRLVLHVRPLLRGVPARRPVAPPRRDAAERLGLDRRVRAPDRFFVWWQFLRGGEAGPRRIGRRREKRQEPEGADRWPSRRAASGPPASVPRVLARELELDLDAFEGPFDLLLTLVLRDELALGRGRRRRDRARASASS